MDLRGKTALVTGASSGIGRATARTLADEGVTLAIAGRRPLIARATYALRVGSAAMIVLLANAFCDACDLCCG